MVGVIGTILALVLLVILVYKGWGVIQTAFLMALLVIITNVGSMGNVFTALQNYFFGVPHALETGGYSAASGIIGFAGANLFVILTGSLFGTAMAESGAAKAIAIGLGKRFGAKNAILITMITSCLMIAGGISAFVCMYAVFPLAVVLFHEANIPRKFLLGSYWCATLACVFLPGVPTVHNIVPCNYIGTTVMAAPGISIICAIFLFLLDFFYLKRCAKKAAERGDGFVVNPETDGVYLKEGLAEEDLPNFWLALAAPVMAIVLCIVSNYTVVEAGLISTNNAVSTILILTSLYCIVLFRKRMRNPMETVTNGIKSGLMPVFLVGAVVGFGNVVAKTDLYNSVLNFALNMDVGPYFSTFITVNILAGITASGLGAIQIFMANCAQRFMEMGASAELLHRVACMSAAGLDSLPNNGAIVTSFNIMGSDFKESYETVFVITVLNTLIAALLGVILATIL